MAQVVSLTGKLDLAGVAGMHAALSAHQDGDVVCDLEGVSHMGALGLQVLLAASHTIAARGDSFIVTGPTEKVSQQCAAMGLDIETFKKGTR